MEYVEGSDLREFMRDARESGILNEKCISAIISQVASALDYATDAKLRAALRTLEGETTIFIVSQRASTIMHADKIIVLDDGEVAGLGTHEELLASCEVYQEIYYSQYEKGGAANA